MKKVENKGKSAHIRIGVSTFDLSEENCDTTGKNKALSIAPAGWNCSADDKNTKATHVCIRADDNEFIMSGYRSIIDAKPLSNTYMVFTDFEKHVTQISFWDVSIADQLCSSFKNSLEKSGMKDARCVGKKK
ncbi:MAG: hypothetical protein EOP48_02780 [Sphingobacteriales bacterium]|nr:MAG: hypothetical protein EOP48_02780 [Sphingobacteriales bacterium]